MTPEPSEHEGLHINSAEVAQTLDHPLSREAAKVQEPLDDYTLHPYKDPGLDPLPTFDKSLKYADDGLKVGIFSTSGLSRSDYNIDRHHLNSAPAIPSL